jgi:hypothetical protein
MTPREFQWRYEAAMKAERTEIERLALLACWVMNPWLKKPMTPNKLLNSGRSRDRLEGDALFIALTADLV